MVTRQRSPNYPGVDLEEAIEASQTLYQHFQRGEFTLEDAAKAWKYTSVSGPVRVKLAALRQFGLIDGKKGDNPRLSRQALTFALRNRASREYIDATKLACISTTTNGRGVSIERRCFRCGNSRIPYLGPQFHGRWCTKICGCLQSHNQAC